MAAYADNRVVTPTKRKEILSRYLDHKRRFDAAAARRTADPPRATLLLTPTIPGGPNEPTTREIEVLQLVADGCANREIGTRLFLSEETIKSHVRGLLVKLPASNRAHAVAIGLRCGRIV